MRIAVLPIAALVASLAFSSGAMAAAMAKPVGGAPAAGAMRPAQPAMTRPLGQPIAPAINPSAAAPSASSNPAPNCVVGQSAVPRC